VGHIAIGCALGTVGSAIVSSSLQMVAVMGPKHIVSAKFGLQVGGILPIAAFTFTNFQPTSDRSQLQTALTPIICICVLVASILTYFHYSSDLFTKAYERLAYDLDTLEADLSEAGDRLLDDDGNSMQRQLTDSQPLDPEIAKHGVPTWVAYWQMSHGLLMCIAMYLASLAGYFGDPRMAQTLSLLKLGMDLVGRVLAAAIPYVPGFVRGPWHKVMGTNVLLGVGLGSVCLAKLVGVAVLPMLFTISWCSVFVISIFASSHTDVTSGSYAAVRDRKAIARTNQFVLVAGLLLGLIMSKATTAFLEKTVPIAAAT